MVLHAAAWHRGGVESRTMVVNLSGYITITHLADRGGQVSE